MPIDFPTSPTTGQVYTYLGKSWVYNGTAWDAPKALSEIGAVQTFANAAARTAAIPTPTEGIVSYLVDTNALDIYDGAAWKTSLSVTGGVLQVVQGTTATTITSSSGTWADTGLTATITPRSISSRILVLVSQNGVFRSADNVSNAVQLRILFPNSTSSQFGSGHNFTSTAISDHTSVSGQAFYTHNTLSTITIKTQFASFAGGASVAVQRINPISTITLLEIAN
jgi:hypothetical protein